MKRKYFLIGAFLILAVVAVTAIAYSHLPARVPSHWNIHGRVDAYTAPWTLFVIMPAVMAGIRALFAILPWLSPRQFEVQSFESTYLYIMLVILCLMAYIHLLQLLAALNGDLNINRALVGGLCLLFALLGNVMGKVRRNFYVGVRTPWTLASERVWNATHRFAARAFVLGGVAGLLLAILGIPFYYPMVVLMVGALAPVIYSLVFYKQLERRGEL
jgi:uncharacterized membrane protein